MTTAFRPNPFDLLGQTELYVYPVHLSGKVEPQLKIAWGSFHGGFFSAIPVFFQRARLDKNAPPSEVFPDVTVDHRLPFIGFVAAAVLHAAIFLLPWPNIPLSPVRNSAFDNTQLTWSGPIDDLPLLKIPKSKPAAEPEADPSPSAAAFHPRQRINTDPIRPTHPRQTLVNPAAPPDPPKFLPDMPNVVQLASVRAPARPHIEISEKTLAKLHPKVAKTAATTDAPVPEIANVQQQTAALNIAASTAGPEKPKLQIDPSSAPHAAQHQQSGDNVAAPEIPVEAASGSTAPSTLIALSASPAPPSPVVPVPQGNLAARVAISPDGKPGAAGNSPGSAGGNGSGATASVNSGGGAGNNAVGISISGGSPKPNSTVSGLGAPAKLIVPRTQSALKRPDASVSIEDPPDRTGPPNFAALPPGAKPEEIFASKHVYSMNVNMPNLNSASGHWIIHFSELHLAEAANRSANVTSPVPVHKVDPKYPQDLAAQYIEGEVILYGVIRRDGTVDSIQKVRGIDPQLDANSIEAFAQWKFQPATREGVPVDLEAVVHIPFKTHDRRDSM